MTEPSEPPRQRVRITSPLTSASAHVRRTAREEIDESTGVGEVYMRSLIRSQLRTALAVVSTLMLTVGALPLTFALFPELTEVRIGRFPLPWIVLGAGVYPGLCLLGWLYVRQAERAERDFTRLVEHES